MTCQQASCFPTLIDGVIHVDRRRAVGDGFLVGALHPRIQIYFLQWRAVHPIITLFIAGAKPSQLCGSYCPCLFRQGNEEVKVQKE